MASNYPEFWGAAELELWDGISEGHRSDYGALEQDPSAMAYFSAGWTEEGYTPEERQAIRDAFFDYVIEEGYFDDRDDFDWESWKEYMGYQ